MHIRETDFLFERAPDEALFERVRASKVEPRQHLIALKELARRRSELTASAALHAMQVEPSTRELFTNAVYLYSEFARQDAQPELLAALQRRQDPPGIQAVAAALGRVGDARALETLRSINVSDERTRRTLNTACVLISFRLGLATHFWDVSSLVSGQIPEGGEQVTVSLSVFADEHIPSSVEPFIAGVEPMFSNAVQISCSARSFLVAMNRPAAFQYTQVGARQSAVLALVFERNECPDSLTVGGVVLSEPIKEGELSLVIMRFDGQILMSGVLRLASPFMDFEIGTNYPWDGVGATFAGTAHESSGEIALRSAAVWVVSAYLDTQEHPQKAEISL